MPECRSCGSPGVVPTWTAGDLPVCHRYLRSPSDPDPRFPLVLGQCDLCGLVQLVDLVPLAELLVGSDGVVYREPEGHLDDLVERLCRLPGITPGSRVMGLSYKEDTTLDRLRKRGFTDLWRPDSRADLGAQNGGMAAIQAALDPAAARRLARDRGPADVLVVRHLLEHAHRPRELLAACAEMLRPSGWIAFEVPDCAAMFDRGDYTAAWEEHVLYFTRFTFPRLLSQEGLTVAESFAYAYPREDSLIAFARKEPSSGATADDGAVAGERERLRKYAVAFPARSSAIRRHLEVARKGGDRAVIFGAGHLSCLFLNVHGLGDLVDCVLDDDPRKKGCLMPGSHLPVRDSSELLKVDVKTCLSSLSPESEQKVLQKHRAFARRGGRFLSLFPGHKRSIPA